jgi:hypothetical protein
MLQMNWSREEEVAPVFFFSVGTDVRFSFRLLGKLRSTTRKAFRTEDELVKRRIVWDAFTSGVVCP